MGRPVVSFLRDNWFSLLLTVVMTLIIVGMAYLMTLPDQTPREAALEAVILTAASIIASLLVTKIYAERTYSQSLRDHGVQIASGIMVLKRQIETLSEWVAQKREILGENANSSSDHILEHVEQTLQGFRGMTDSALGGIAGVIGDALAQYETVMEQISRIRSDAVQKTTEIQRELQTAVSSSDVARLQAQIQEIAVQTENRIAQLARTSALPIPEPPRRRSATERCPYCTAENTFEILNRIGETREVECKQCRRTFNAHIGSSNEVFTRPHPAGVTASATFLGNAPTVELDDPRVKIRKFLTGIDSWLEPSQLRVLIWATGAADQKLRIAGEVRSPNRLLEEVHSSLGGAISKGMIRRLIKLVFHGRGFQFAPEVTPGYKLSYENDLHPDGVLRAYLSACALRLVTGLQITPKDASAAAEVLVGDLFPGSESTLNQLLKEHYPIQPSEVQGDPTAGA